MLIASFFAGFVFLRPERWTFGRAKQKGPRCEGLFNHGRPCDFNLSSDRNALLPSYGVKQVNPSLLDRREIPGAMEGHVKSIVAQIGPPTNGPFIGVSDRSAAQ